jgi:hypothetical protein
MGFIPASRPVPDRDSTAATLIRERAWNFQNESNAFIIFDT